MLSQGNKKEQEFKRPSLLKKYSKVKNIVLIALLITSISFSLGFEKNTNAEEAIKKIYHIYADDAYIGAVSDIEAVHTVLQAQQNKATSKYNDLKVEAGSNITIISEQVFDTETNDAETLKKLEDAIQVEADAYALLVDDKPVTYLKDEKDYKEAIHLLKLQYVTEQEYNIWAASQSGTTPLPPLEKGEERVLDIAIKQKISGAVDKASPSKILSPEEAVKFLMTGAVEEDTYEVKEGDVLGSIAHAHDLKTSELLALNPGITEDTLLQIGQKLNVTVSKPLVNVSVVRKKKIVENINNAKIVKENDNMFKGKTVVKQEGSDGKKLAAYQIVEENGVRQDVTLLEEKVIKEPQDKIVVVGTKVVSSNGTGDFAWPTVGGYISSGMGVRGHEFHRGIDIARPSNYNILAADNGIVVSAGYDGSYGNKIVINHNNGYMTLYGHLSQINVSVGQVVQKGAVIGIMGQTGNATGVHLHLEVEKNGSLINPLSVINR